MTDALLYAHGAVWGLPMMLLILGVGIGIAVRTRFVQLRLFPSAVRLFYETFRSRKQTGGVSSFRALCTALGATAGTGNIIGVAGAICLGGPGAVFWMWVCGILAMGTKYAEVTLALRYRVSRGGEYLGGPMYMILHGLGTDWWLLAAVYSVFGMIASFGVGNAAQINAVVSGINNVLAQYGTAETLRRNLALGLILAVLIGSMLLGGAKRIGAAAERLVPAASMGYAALCIVVLVLRANAVPEAVASIFRGAFSPEAVTGGAIASAFQALRTGCCRGVFTNEAGMGTASIAHASAEASHPAQQGLMGIMEVFLDTIVLCTLTALMILVSGVRVPYGTDKGGTLTANALCTVCGDWVSILLTAALACFAFATVLGWGMYGGRCAQFLFGQRAWMPFALLQTVAVVIGATLKTETVWLLSELLNGLMAIPNLTVLAALLPELGCLTKEYTKR